MNKKIAVILGDGMADLPDANGDTPMSLARKPRADALVAKSEIGLVKNVPDGMKPGSDTANMSAMGYDPRKCYTGRSPLEAVSMGITLSDCDVTYRANLVTLENGVMKDYSAGEIDTASAREIIDYLAPHINRDGFELHGGISYRHCRGRRRARPVGSYLTPPHDISGREVKQYLPEEAVLREIMLKSQVLLKDCPTNVKRREKGLNEANSLWLWGEGTKPELPSFYKKYGLRGAVISAVDLLKGIALCAGMKSIDVEGATGTLSTDFEGKAKAAEEAFESGCDYVYVHLEAADECGHQGDFEGKKRAIELIDEKILTPIDDYLKASGSPYTIVFLPDHPTPVTTRTHSSDPVPYMIYDSERTVYGADVFDEKHAAESGNFIEHGHTLLSKIIG